MNQFQLCGVAPLSANDRNALLLSAQALRRASLAGQVHKTLRGKNLGLVCEDLDNQDAVLFGRAATELGARVAYVDLGASGLLVPEYLPDTARVLGRLYDGIECQGLPADLLQRIRAAAGVSVYDGIASARHPSAAISTLLDGGDDAQNRVFVVQALLIATLRGHV